jgi:hypothetical protein
MAKLASTIYRELAKAQEHSLENKQLLHENEVLSHFVKAGYSQKKAMKWLTQWEDMELIALNRASRQVVILHNDQLKANVKAMRAQTVLEV